MTLYLVCYDISSDKLRSKLADKLFLVGMERLQYSVFVGLVSDARKRNLLAWVEKSLKNQTACQFMMIPLNEWNMTGFEAGGTEPPDWAYLKGEKLVMFF